MQPLTLINGSATRTLASSDRGLNYGQGLFTTIKVLNGKPQLWSLHMKRLQEGCAKLGFPISAVEKLIKRDLGLIPKADLILKITLTAGVGPRGYATPREYQPTRIIQIDPAHFQSPALDGVSLRVCNTRLAIQPALAGIKHLNRLEQVLARSEWQSTHIAEGIMLDTEGMIVEGTYSNIFWFKSNRLYTPDLSGSGIEGVMRAAVLDVASAQGVEVELVRQSVSVLESADELFMTNALMGICPVKSLGSINFRTGVDSLTHSLKTALNEALDA